MPPAPALVSTSTLRVVKTTPYSCMVMSEMRPYRRDFFYHSANTNTDRRFTWIQQMLHEPTPERMSVNLVPLNKLFC